MHEIWKMSLFEKWYFRKPVQKHLFSVHISAPRILGIHVLFDGTQKHYVFKFVHFLEIIKNRSGWGPKSHYHFGDDFLRNENGHARFHIHYA